MADADLLLPFADALLSFDPARIAPLRAAIVARLGEAAMLDAAAVIGGFNGITRIADATGIPLEEGKDAD
ncbi:MAG: alkylhydroperoxidase-related (seleno)protein, partial [Alphaproteobacteria bacterium]|nr:alkylhydroperoxidase-related (seleno)protein [Alphaproteobacteria bacterium]